MEELTLPPDLAEPLFMIAQKGIVQFKNQMIRAIVAADAQERSSSDFSTKLWEDGIKESNITIVKGLEELTEKLLREKQVLPTTMPMELRSQVQEMFKAAVEPHYLDAVKKLNEKNMAYKPVPRFKKPQSKEPGSKTPKPTEMSPKLAKMVEEMLNSIEPHEDVYPPAPKSGELVIPIGGLAKCICSPNCTKELPQPAYRIITKAEQEERCFIVESETLKNKKKR